MPVAMLEVKGIEIKIANAGKASSNLDQRMRDNPPIMKLPTIMSAGAVMALNDEIV